MLGTMLETQKILSLFRKVSFPPPPPHLSDYLTGFVETSAALDPSIVDLTI
jgi:hypothetical protein